MSDLPLKEQYERFPYPPRNSADEVQMLYPTGLDQLDRLHHYGWNAQKDLSSLRVLVAGGGTGDATVFLAEQLRFMFPKLRPTILHVDLSASSLAIAKARVQTRKLEGVRFIQGSLLDIKDLCHQQKDAKGEPIASFDYINCSGVLHHLPDPQQGLNALSEVLDEDGVMGIMLYGQYGRTGVYQMQKLLKEVLRPGDNLDTQVQLCRRIVEKLPPSNWLARQAEELPDLSGGDAELYDLLLHSQDRAYNVDEIYDFTENSGLSWLSFVRLDGTAKRDYDPSHLCEDPEVQGRLAGKSPRQREALAELWRGDMSKHSFYCRKTPPPKAKVQSDWIYDLSQRLDLEGSLHTRLAQLVHEHLGQICRIERDNCSVRLNCSPEKAALLAQLDGKTPLHTLLERCETSSSASPALRLDQLRSEFEELSQELAYYDWIFARPPTCPRYPRIKDLQIATYRRIHPPKR